MQIADLPLNTNVPRTCLLVDESRTGRHIATAMFRELGYFTTEARSGGEALAFCLEFQPDVILLYGSMPVMDGIAFLTKLRAMPMSKQPKVILCSTENTLHGLMPLWPRAPTITS
jgi:two-component system chemotaxis response regulator CheY